MVCMDLTASRSEVPSFWEAGLLAATCPFCLSKSCAWGKTLPKDFLIVSYCETGVNGQVIHLYISALFWFHTCFCCPFDFKMHGRKYQLKLLLIGLVVAPCSAQWQVHFFPVIWRCSGSNLAGEDKPAPAAASYRSKASQRLEERIVLNVPHLWVKAGEGWRGLCRAGGRERFSGKLLKVSQADQHVERLFIARRTAVSLVFRQSKITFFDRYCSLVCKGKVPWNKAKFCFMVTINMKV